MPGHQMLHASASSRPHPSFWLTGQIQSQAMSHAKFVFLIVLVVFFIVLFVAAYVWMRRPDFGQKGARPTPAASGGLALSADHGSADEAWTDGEGVPVDTSSGRP